MLLTKHHALGNDFLVLLDSEGDKPIEAATAIEACDRRRGIGADGIIRVTRGTSAPFRMELFNEDGSGAEMSGNGISCMAQALHLADGIPSAVAEIETDAGLRTVELIETVSQKEHRMRVAMGSVELGEELSEWTGIQIIRARSVNVGNPHVVLHVADPTDAPDLVEIGEKINAATPGGTNVELITPGGDGAITMSVYERGVGPTQACGTGAVAAAAAAASWGLAPTTVTVNQPGGPANVELGEPAHLTVPVVAIARIAWPI